MRKMIVAAVSAALALALAVPAIAAGHVAEVTVEHRINGVAAGAKLLDDPKALGKEANVDIWVNDAPFYTDGFEFGDVIGPVTLEPGTYNIKVKVAGTDTTIIDEDVTVSAGDEVRLVARFGKGGMPTLGIR
jgi:hypothetical protein